MTVLNVYVRKDSNTTRLLSTPALPDVPAKEVLERGWAHDGNAWIQTVELGDLHAVQVKHRDWMRSLGYDVEYK